MAVIDLIILGIVFLSVLVSVMRGFVKEALSLAAWILAAWVAMSFANDVDAKLADTISSPWVRKAVALVVLFVPTLFVGVVINSIISAAVRRTQLSGTDRALGMVFGVSRGLLIIVVGLLLIGNSPVTQKPWWKESLLLDHFQVAAGWIKNRLPNHLSVETPLGLNLTGQK